jgi:hypothetical protein
MFMVRHLPIFTIIHTGLFALSIVTFVEIDMANQVNADVPLLAARLL